MFLLLFIRYFVSYITPDYIETSCSTEPRADYIKPLIFSPNQGLLVTCDKKQRSYLKIPAPSDNSYGKVSFSSFTCFNGKWKNDDFYYRSKRLLCSLGCREPARKEFLNAISDPSKCKVLNDEGDTEYPPAYISCELRCMDGYYSDSQAENQLSNQEVYCEEKLGTPVWEINDGTNLEPFVRCVPGCFSYGSDHEDVHGMVVNFKTVGEIDKVDRYTSGEIWCDTYNGFFYVSEKLQPSVIMNCAGGDHWEPVNPNYYCKKGCRKPGGSFGGKKIEGYSFGCSDGSKGWYLRCAFSCESKDGYLMVDKNNRFPKGPHSENIDCNSGVFDLSAAINRCIKECNPAFDSCKSGSACTGKVYNNDGSDSGRRFCSQSGASGSAAFRFAMRTESALSAFMVNVFGGYEWLT